MAEQLRCAIIIVYNGLHHLQHLNFMGRMLDIFDHLIFVEGHAKPGGSTYWCNDLKYQSAISTDGTREYLKEYESDRVHIVLRDKAWSSKDEQFNAGIDKLREITDKCTLWQVDADEVWRKEQIEANELALESSVGCVGFHHIIGKCQDDLLLAEGKWGSGKVNRVWRWEGQSFVTHEPPMMEGQGVPQLLPEKFLHFSYYFEKDIEFKNKYYKGYGDLYKSWKELQGWKPSQFPCHIYRAFGRKSSIGRTNTRIVRRVWEAERLLLRESSN